MGSAWYLTILAGAAGGLLYGVTGYLMARKDGEAFDKWKLVNTCALPVVLGAAAGVYANDTVIAFTAGMTVRTLQDLGGKYAFTPTTTTAPPTA